MPTERMFCRHSVLSSSHKHNCAREYGLAATGSDKSGSCGADLKHMLLQVSLCRGQVKDGQQDGERAGKRKIELGKGVHSAACLTPHLPGPDLPKARGCFSVREKQLRSRRWRWWRSFCHIITLVPGLKARKCVELLRLAPVI